MEEDVADDLEEEEEWGFDSYHTIQSCALSAS